MGRSQGEKGGPERQRFRRLRPVRFLGRCALFVLLGLGTTTAVAWGLAFTSISGVEQTGSQFADPRRASVRPSPWEYHDIVVANVVRSAGSIRIRTSIVGTSVHISFDGPPGSVNVPLATEILPPWSYPHAMPWTFAGRPLPSGFEWRCVVARGWPFPALYAVGELDDSMKERRYGELSLPWPVSVKGTGTSPRMDRPAALPYLPAWPGLLANATIYGAVWWAILFVPGALLRLNRRRHGRCASCGYDLRTLPAGTCPECGMARTSTALLPAQSAPHASPGADR
jgi:hypothetical protein